MDSEMVKKKLNVAVVGVTGAVGEEMLKILEERDFPVGVLHPMASQRSADRTVLFRGETLPVQPATAKAFSGIDVALFSAGGSVSRKLAPKAVRAGATVIDNSSAFRMDPRVPLVIPEINPHDVHTHKGIIANPNCTTTVMLMALYPFRGYGIRRIVASSYQAVSGAGAWGIEELQQQTLQWALDEQARRLIGRDRREPIEPDRFPHPIAFNLIPHVGTFLDSGYSTEEVKCLEETRKILNDPEIRVTATTVRLPVLRSHCVSVNIETEKRLRVPTARNLIRKAAGVALLDRPAKNLYPMPINASGKDDCLVGRIREDDTIKWGLNLWVAGDQLRKGAALNTVQIAEILLASARN